MLLCLLWNATWAAPNVFLTTFIFLFFYSSSSWIVPTQGTVGVTLENEANAFETEVGNAEVEEETATAMASSAASVSEWVKVKDDDSGADYFIEKRAQNSYPLAPDHELTVSRQQNSDIWVPKSKSYIPGPGLGEAAMRVARGTHTRA